MNKLMTKFDYSCTELKDGAVKIEVTRLKDGAVKSFRMAGTSVNRANTFMSSITDDLAESYFPRDKKR